MLNIMKFENDTRDVMLGDDVISYMEAMHWLDYYRMTYGNHFFLCHLEDNGMYYAIH